MRTITAFPERFELVNERVAELTLTSALSRDEHDAEELAFMENLRPLVSLEVIMKSKSRNQPTSREDSARP